MSCKGSRRSGSGSSGSTHTAKRLGVPEVPRAYSSAGWYSSCSLEGGVVCGRRLLQPEFERGPACSGLSQGRVLLAPSAASSARAAHCQGSAVEPAVQPHPSLSTVGSSCGVLI